MCNQRASINDNVTALVRILIIANTGWYLYKFRYNLIQSLLQLGYVICIACPPDKYSQQLVDELGVQWQAIPGNPRRIVPHMELSFAFKLVLACWRFKPQFCLTFTPRVNCFITLVQLRTLNIKLIRNISGLGDSLLSEKKIQTALATFLYRRAYDSFWTFYQNQDDMKLGLENRFSRPERTSLLPGSGVDLERFRFSERTDDKPHRVFLAARLIPAKGYLDYIELARHFNADSRVEFHLAGAFSEESGISDKRFEDLLQGSGVVYHGYTEDLTPLYEQSDLFVLPSTYGEGLPRVLLEAAASGCILIAYDNSGSKRAINQSVNGWITTEPSISALREALQTFLALTRSDRQAMSIASRRHVENGFSETEVINAYLALIDK